MLLMALDGGKTKTTCALFDGEGNILSLVSSGPTGLMLPYEIIRHNLWRAITLVLSETNTRLRDVSLVVIGLADLDTRRDWMKANTIISSLRLPSNVRVIVEHDAAIAYYAVTYGRPGIAVIAGTGSIAFGVNSKGERAKSGGWGWLFGDEGSAFWIAREALTLAARAVDGRGRRTKLVDEFMRRFKLREFLNMLDVIYKDLGADPSRIAELAELVDEVAREGDELAENILIRAGVELAEAAYAVAMRLRMVEEDVVIGGVGSVFNSIIVRKAFHEHVKSKLRRARLRPPLIGYQPIIRSIVLALKTAGIEDIEGRVKRLIAGLSRAEIKGI